ncbi:MAG: hypothetical protein AB8G15_04490 [Saprospiraceae bacterium]
MKKLTILFLAMLFSFAATAEYNGDFFYFTLNLKDGGKRSGHVYLSDISYQAKGMDYQRYLESNIGLFLRNPYEDGKGKHAYYLDRIRYDVNDEEETFSFFTLLNKVTIELSTIQSLQIHERKGQSYAVNIYHEHRLSDTVWMRTPVLEKFSVGAHFCDYRIYLHEKNAATDRWITQLKNFLLQQEKHFKKLEENIDAAYDEEKAIVEQALTDYEESLDDALGELIAQSGDAKVVIIQYCSC